MIINSANKFIDKLNRWMTFFNVVYWILVLLPLGIFFLFSMAAGPPRFFIEFIMGVVGFVIYLAAAFFFHRIASLGFEFMKAIVTTALECQQELTKIRSELKKPDADQAQLEMTPKPSPYNF